MIKIYYLFINFVLQFVIDPELAAKRKIARQQKKKEAKKRKMSQARGKKFAGGKKSKKDTDLEII